jgi:heptosyltransferase-2
MVNIEMSYKKLVVIKTGEKETFLEDNFGIISLGDVLRTTVFLRLRNQFSEFLWLTSAEAYPLIKGDNVKVELLSTFSCPSLNDKETLIINLERDSKVKSILRDHWENVLGFVFKNDEWVIKNHQEKFYRLDAWNQYCMSQELRTWGQKLLAIGGFKLNEFHGTMPPIQTLPTVDIGLNWLVGKKWPSKNIPQEVWNQLEMHLSKKYSVSWQQGLNSLDDYIRWISSCRLVITSDSLGLHLAMALNIPAVAIFGPTDPGSVDVHSKTAVLQLEIPAQYKCMPCHRGECNQEKHCSHFFPYQTVLNAVERLCRF